MANYLHKTADPVDFRPSSSTAQISGYVAADWFTNPDVSAVYDQSTGEYLVATKYWSRPLADPVTEMSQAEKDAVDAAQLAELLAAAKLEAKDIHDSLEDLGLALRAVVKLVVAELNDIRTWTRDFQAGAASASNLSQFQTAIAALPSLDDRTYAQARTQIGNEIDGE